MAYKSKYRMTFNGFRTEDTVIDFMVEDYTGSRTDVDGGENPFNLRLLNDTNVNGEQAIFELVSDTNFKYLPLFLGSNKKVKTVVYRGSDTNLLLKGDFVGNLDEWDTVSNFEWDNDTASCTSTSGYLQKTVTLHEGYGNYDVQVQYSGGAVGDIIAIYYGYTLLSSTTLTSANLGGRISYTTPIGYPIPSTGIFQIAYVGSSSTFGLTDVYFNKDESEYPFPIYWKGFLQPDVYSEPHISAPYISRFTANCGLGLLKDIQYKDADDKLLFGRVRTMDIIANCLEKTGTLLPIKTCIDVWYDITGFTDGDDPLDEVYISQDGFILRSEEEKSTNCYDVLNRILATYKAAIYQSNGYWIIEREKNKWNSDKYILYTKKGDKIGNLPTTDKVITLTNSQASDFLVYRDQEQQLEIDLSEPKIEVKNTQVYLKDSDHGSCVFDVQYNDQNFEKVTVILNNQGLEIFSAEKYPQEIHDKILELAENKIKAQKMLPKGFDPKKKPPKNWQNNY